MSSLRNAQRGTRIITIFSSLVYCQVFYCYDANLINPPLRCYGKTIMCRLLIDIIYGLITILYPLLIMSIFCIMTIVNIRKIYSAKLLRKRIFCVNNINRKSLILTCRQRERLKKLDHYLRQAIFVQIFFINSSTSY